MILKLTWLLKPINIPWQNTLLNVICWTPTRVIRKRFQGGSILNGPKRCVKFYQAQTETGYRSIHSAQARRALPLSKANPWCHDGQLVLRAWFLLWGRVKGTGSEMRKSIFYLGNSKYVARVKQMWKREERIRVEPNSVELSMQRKRSYQIRCLPGHLSQVNSTCLGSYLHFFLPWLIRESPGQLFPSLNLSLLIYKMTRPAKFSKALCSINIWDNTYQPLRRRRLRGQENIYWFGHVSTALQKKWTGKKWSWLHLQLLRLSPTPPGILGPCFSN